MHTKNNIPENNLPVKTCTCGKCGHEGIEVPVVSNTWLEIPAEWVYETCGIECPNCKAHSTGGNFKTGVVDCWITARDAAISEAIYQNQLIEADIREAWLAEEEY